MRTIRLFCALLLSPFIVTQNAVATSVGDFALLDHNGTFHQASYYSDHDAIVILVESSATLASERARTAVSNIESVAQSGKVKAFVLSPNSGVERDALQDAVGKLGSNLPVLIDETQLVTQSLDLSRYGEAVVIDPKSMNVVYRGASDSLKGVTDFSVSEHLPRQTPGIWVRPWTSDQARPSLTSTILRLSLNATVCPVTATAA